MRNYELAYIADPDLDEQALLSLEEKVKGWIQAAGGEVVKIDRWGKRRLAYSIKKRVEGFYTIVTALLPPSCRPAGPAAHRATGAAPARSVRSGAWVYVFSESGNNRAFLECTLRVVAPAP